MNKPLGLVPTGAVGPGTAVRGSFVCEGDETWYRIDAFEQLPPSIMALAGDSDLWAYVWAAGSLAAGRRDAEGSFPPYETVDKIHLRGDNTGPRTWILIEDGYGPTLWQPFARKLDRPANDHSGTISRARASASATSIRRVASRSSTNGSPPPGVSAVEAEPAFPAGEAA